ncbi:polysaccharide biosynthesis protein [Clostridium swellfunianum]|uniref:polysaccharide biosynthesis protein n=1 Tax=Clostridium swellfunianum TaxID=1367462 RepID=UPI00202F8C95|nr:nucleoside-diphosphate sugar epimerase/dehydratase [Clostridium swellfunianum]MCM0647447.1 polysaccharide biosynthesis protein [Clostridium swellfunianum]
MKNYSKFIVYDIILTILSLYIALLIRFDFGKVSGFMNYMHFFKISVIPVVIFVLFFNYLFNLYNRMWKYASINELLSIAYSVTISNIVFMFYSYFINYKFFESGYFRFPFTVHIIFWLLTVVFLSGARFVYKAVLYNRRIQKYDVSDSINVLIVGAGEAAVLLMKEIRKHKELNYNIIGLIDDNEAKQNRVINGVRVIGTRQDIVRISNSYNIDEIIVAMPSVDEDTKRDVYNICKQTKCKLRTLPGIYEIIIADKVTMGSIRDVNIEDLLGREEVKLNNSGISKYINDKVVLVTGGGGSIGSELCRQISKFKPKKLLILDIYENGAYDLQMELNRLYPDMDKQVLIASIRDERRLNQVFEEYKPNVVFHAAAHKHVPLMEENPSEVIKNNIIGTYNLAKTCHEQKVQRFVQISTDKAVNPTNIMGATKRFCEIIIQAFDKISDTEYVAVRFGNVLGSNGSVIPLFKKQIAAGGPVTVTHPEINRFFMTIPEAAQLVLQAGSIAQGGEIFVLDMGKPVKIADLARDLITLSGYKPNVDINIEYTGLREGEKLYEELLMDEVALTSTEHEKIFIEKPMEYDINFVNKSIEEFREVVYKDKESIFKLVEQKVPTYNRKMKANN